MTKIIFNLNNMGMWNFCFAYCSISLHYVLANLVKQDHSSYCIGPHIL